MSEKEKFEINRKKGLKASKTKGKEVEKEAAQRMLVSKHMGKYFPALKEMTSDLGEDEETEYRKIREYFISKTEWYEKERLNEEGKEKGTLQRQIYAATVNSSSRIWYGVNKKPRGYDENLDLFFAVEGDLKRLVRFIPGRHGNWLIKKVRGGVRVEQDENDPVKFKIAGRQSEDASFDSLRATMLDFKTHMRANYLPVTARFLIKNYPDECAWDDISKEIEMLNNFYEPTKTGRLVTAMEMVSEQQRRENYFGITCFDENGDQTGSTTKVSKCSLLGNLTEEQLDELKEICGRLIAFHHCREMA